MKTKTWIATAGCTALLCAMPPTAWAQKAKTPLPPSSGGAISYANEYNPEPTPEELEVQAAASRISAEANQWIRKGSEFAKASKYNEAIDAFNKADAVYVKNKWAIYHLRVTGDLANIYVKVGRTKEAMDIYRALLYRQPEQGEDGKAQLLLEGRSLMEYALLLCQSGQYEEARVAYEKGLPAVNSWRNDELALEHFEPGNANPKRFLAAVYVGLALMAEKDNLRPTREEGKVDPATEVAYNYYQKALKQYPTFALAHYCFAETIRVRNFQLGRTGPAVWQETTDEYKKAAQYGRGEVKAAAAKHIN